MIPEDPTIFNTFLCSVPRNFDDYETRLRHWVGQDAVPTAGGRHLLYFCTICKRAWYKAGKCEYPRITTEQLALLGEVLHTHASRVSALPEALCGICSAIYLGGSFSVEEYCQDRTPHTHGYRFTWDGASSPPTHLMGMICRRDQLTLGKLLNMEPDVLATPMGAVRAVLTWFEALPLPDEAFAYTDEESQRLSQRVPPGTGTDPLPWVWRGYSWVEDCTPLQAEVLVSLAMALHPSAPCSLARLFVSWKMLARTMRLVL